MKKTKVFVVTIISLLLIGVFALPGSAQSPVTAEVDRNRLSTDEVLVLKVTIDSTAGQASQPALPALDGFEILGSSSGTQISIVNGDMNMQATYSYSLHPTQAGQLMINPVSVQIDGQLYSTQPIMIEVSQGTGQVQPAPNQGIPSMPGFPTRPNFPNIPGFPNLNNLFPTMPGMPSNQVNPGNTAPPMDPADAPTELVGQPFFIEALVDNPNPYQGEQVLYTFRFYQAENLFDQPEYQSPSFTGFWSEERSEDQVDYTTEAAGRAYRVTELQTVLFPTGVGEVTIEPATLTIPGDFFSRGMALQTQPITMNIRPLPDNAPANFQGAVGQFDIQAQADTAKTKVNETVTLHVTLRGVGNMNNLADPLWSEGPEWRAFDSKATVNTHFTDGVFGGVRSYERLLVPTQAGDLLLPAIVFSYFNPETESYETTSSEPILISVLGDVAAGVAPATPNGS
ncbi:MAG: BatD family protein, partial [Anaerolineaceae bacterium]